MAYTGANGAPAFLYPGPDLARFMTNHIIWIGGLLGHLVLLAVLFARRRAASFPWFTLLIGFYLLRSIGLQATAHFTGHPAHRFATQAIDLTDVCLQAAVLAELMWMALRPLHATRQAMLSLLLVASGVLIVLRLAPPMPVWHRMALVLIHFLLSVLMLEWAILLAFLLRSLRISWRGHLAAISFGFGAYSLALLAGGGYFTVGREMSDFVLFAFVRIGVYLLVLLWWTVCLWLPE
jgi:hypothetical protein